MTRDHFSITGIIEDQEVTITWNDVDGLIDPTGRTTVMILGKDEIALTPTGPFYVAGERTAEVAIVTALSAFANRVTEVDEAGQSILAAIHDDNPVPPGAVA